VLCFAKGEFDSELVPTADAVHVTQLSFIVAIEAVI
jgi:hypothetical protein